MVGTPIEQVQDGMATIINELRTDPYALETAWVSVIAFAGKAKMLSPLEELYKFYPPKFPIGGGTSLGTALNFLMDEMDRSLQKTTVEVKGDLVYVQCKSSFHHQLGIQRHFVEEHPLVHHYYIRHLFRPDSID